MTRSCSWTMSWWCGMALACVVASAASASGVSGQGTWESTLQERDLDGDGETDAFYDTVLNVTWLRDAGASGIVFREEALAWARNLRVGGYADWRLPSMIDTGDPGCDWSYGGTDCGFNVRTTGGPRSYSEMEHLLRETLGNTPYCDQQGQCDRPGWGLSNTGGFRNLQSYFYWLGTEYRGGSNFGWYYYTPTIYQSFGIKLLGMHAMAVRDGDSVPQGRRGGSIAAPATGATAVASVPGQGTWQTTLEPRDLDGDGSADAFYDTQLNVTWLRDLGAAGLQFWPQAMAWVRDLRAGGYSDWRLPKVVDVLTEGCTFSYVGTDCGFNVLTERRGRVFSELAHLMHQTLGNQGYCSPLRVCDQPGWRDLNTGDFLNMQPVFIWTSVQYPDPTDLAWYYYPYTGYQSFGHQLHLLQVLPVRDGDSGQPIR
jgi:hypothetical protein